MIKIITNKVYRLLAFNAVLRTLITGYLFYVISALI
jgi:hypothetical protein